MSTTHRPAAVPPSCADERVVSGALVPSQRPLQVHPAGGERGQLLPYATRRRTQEVPKGQEPSLAHAGAGGGKWYHLFFQQNESE